MCGYYAMASSPEDEAVDGRSDGEDAQREQERPGGGEQSTDDALPVEEEAGQEGDPKCVKNEEARQDNALDHSDDGRVEEVDDKAAREVGTQGDKTVEDGSGADEAGREVGSTCSQPERADDMKEEPNDAAVQPPHDAKCTRHTPPKKEQQDSSVGW